MNANELADWLDNTTDSEDWGELAKYYKWCKENVAPMLRQQALEIQALHQILGYEGIEVGKEYLDECVADLRKAQENG